MVVYFEQCLFNTIVNTWLLLYVKYDCLWKITTILSVELIIHAQSSSWFEMHLKYVFDLKVDFNIAVLTRCKCHCFCMGVWTERHPNQNKDKFFSTPTTSNFEYKHLKLVHLLLLISPSVVPCEVFYLIRIRALIRVDKVNISLRKRWACIKGPIGSSSRKGVMRKKKGKEE